MDQFSAHLDRGWDLVQRGDSRGAEVSARRALELDNQAPEAYNLLGYVAALQGDFDDALENYRQALALDDCYLEAMLNAAEICVHPLGEFDEAISFCDDALELAETDDEAVDCLLLKFDSLLGKSDLDGATKLCLRMPTGPFENPVHAFLVGRAMYEAADIARARPLIEQAIKAAPDNSEAHYYLGLLSDEQGDAEGATRCFLKSRELDLNQPPPPWTLTPETFEHTARKVVGALPEDVGQFLSDAPIYVADVPGVEVVADGVDPRAPLLVEVAPPPARTKEPLPDAEPAARLFVYQRNIERIAGALHLIEGEFRLALERELRATFLAEETPLPSGMRRPTHSCKT